MKQENQWDIFQVKGIACAKILRQEYIWFDQGTKKKQYDSANECMEEW